MDSRIYKLVLFCLVCVGAAALVLGGISVALGFAISPLLGVIAPLPLLLFVPMAATGARAFRKRQELAITTYVEQAVRLDMPIPRLLMAAAYSEKQKVSRRLRDLAESLESGAALESALEFTVPEMSDRSIRLIGAASRNGNLPATLARLVDEGRRGLPVDSTTPAFFAAYPVMMTLFLAGIVSVIMIFVMPKYEQIFKDYGMRLPETTQFLIGITANIGPLITVIVVIIALGLLGRGLWDVFVPLGAGVHPARVAGFWIASTFPPTRGAIRNRDLADVFEVLADATESGLPIDNALAEAGALHTSAAMHRMILDWHEHLQSGQSLAEAALRAGWPDLCSGLLATAQGAGDVPAAFRFLSRYYREKYSRLLILLRGAFIPVVVIIFAIPVAWVCLALFTPMVAMIEHLVGPASHVVWRRL
jgi:type IV pilus assembly protein PilC